MGLTILLTMLYSLSVPQTYAGFYFGDAQLWAMSDFTKDAAAQLPLSSGPRRNILPNALPKLGRLQLLER